MARPWAIPAMLLALAFTLQSLAGSSFLSLSPIANAQGSFCASPGVNVSPSVVTAPGQVQITADGFSPGTTVSMSVTPPAGWSFTPQVQPTADSSCRAIGSIQIQACSGCPSGTAQV